MDPTSDITLNKDTYDKVPTELEPLLKCIKNYLPNESLDEVVKAFLFASRAHSEMKRLSGEPYIQHCLSVALILAELEVDIPTICAALLHDVVEDTGMTHEELEKRFGSEVSILVEGVTKIGKQQFDTREEREVENMRKIILAMAQDIRVIIIKLADRLHNMRTLQYHSPEKQKRIATDTLDIYAPIAHRLGIGRIKWELEDLCLRFLKPDVYSQIHQMVAKKRREREEYIVQVIKVLSEKLAESKIKSRIEGRPKHFYSIYQKMLNQNRDIDEIYDLTAIRIITDSKRNCYEALGVVHTLYKPILGRFKDYIAMPKSNMYQSLHTTVWGVNNEPLEIQIRTDEMHLIAEEGIAAHWLYKEGIHLSKEQYDKRFGWLRQLIESQEETNDPKEFMRNLKIELFSDEVFVFTPKGSVKELPVGATPVDFAFAVHSEVGLRCTGAKVNGKLVPLRTSLNTGDIVEIITNKSAKPSRDWLSYIKTSRARNKITHFLKQEEATELIKTGREEVARELKQIHIGIQEVSRPDGLVKIAIDLGFPGADELFIAVASGKVSAKNIVNRLFPSKDKILKGENLSTLNTTPISHSQEGVIIQGVSDALVRFGRCCHPVPGDPICGFITRGRGISIHKIGCQSIKPFLQDKSRIIKVAWDNTQEKYPVPIRIIAHDRHGLLRDVLDLIASFDINVYYAKAEQANKKANIHITIDIVNNKQLDDLIKHLGNINGVIETVRINK